MSNPVLYCNFEKQDTMNNHIHKRNHPHTNLNIIEDLRSEYRVNHQQVSLNTYDHNKNLNQRIQNFDNVFSTLEQGIGNKLNYLQKIDIDSELRIKPPHISSCNIGKFIPDNQKLTSDKELSIENYKDTLCKLHRCPNIWNNHSEKFV